jgi:hypothetical protein
MWFFFWQRNVRIEALEEGLKHFQHAYDNFDKAGATVSVE